MDFEKICMMFTMREPYYGILLSSMERVKSKRTRTIGVGRSGNVFRLEYNDGFIGQLSIDETLEILKHEMLHVAFNHFSLWGDENVTKELHDIRNIAEDMEINSYINVGILARQKPCVASAYGWKDRLGTREYFDRLMNLPRQTIQYGNGQFDDHSLWPNCDSEMEKEQLEQVIDDMLVLAAEETEKGGGSIPRELKIKIELIRNRKHVKPVTDWKRFFRRYLGNEFTELIRKSRRHESKRFEGAAGNTHRRKSSILVAIDTSNSVSMPEYNEFFDQINTLSQTANFHVVECDTRIQHEYDYKGKPNQVLHGGGGTLFQPPVDMYIKNRKKYDALVYFTDGGAVIPKNTPRETLWVISSKGDKNRSRYKVNGASAVFIPEHKKVKF